MPATLPWPVGAFGVKRDRPFQTPKSSPGSGDFSIQREGE
jgi:hypothetical protein